MLTQLILAHLLGDFLLQPNSWVIDKEKNKWRSKYLYFHVLLHAILAFVLLWNLELWWVALSVLITHFFIDLAKLQFQKSNNKRIWFFIDQGLHLLVILGLCYLKFPNFDFSNLLSPKNLKIFTALLFLTIPSSIIIKTLIGIWTPNSTEKTKLETDSLQNAGKYIGILERLLVFTFIITNHWEGIGFMIAAKSVFRFSDLAEAKQRKLTEYVLIGTLLSFGIAIIIGIIIKAL